MRIIRSAGVVAAVVAWVLLVYVPPATADTPCPTLTPSTEPAHDQLACADLRGADLSQDDLAGADLHGSDLSGANLLQADLTGANLAGANLRGADLAQADLIGADLTGADLRGADLTQADLREADLRDADLTGADLSQADVDDVDLRGSELRDVTGLDAGNMAGVRYDSTSLDDHTQVAHLLLWPAVATMLWWWRRRIGHLMKHRATTPVRPAEVVAVGAGIPVLVLGVYLFAVGVSRGFGHIPGLDHWLWAVEPGPLGVIAAEPVRQIVVGAIMFVVGGILLIVARLRRKVGEQQADSGQVVLGKPSLGAPFPEFSTPVRRVAHAAALLGVADVVVVIALWWFDGLPTSGPWQASSALGHVVVVGLAAFYLFQAASTMRVDDEVATLTGVVFAGAGRNPYVWLSGTSKQSRPANQILPWSALEHVHLVRMRGNPDPKAAMVTVRPPGAKKVTEYPGEMRIRRSQMAGLRAAVPDEMITEHVRIPSSE